VEKAVVQYLRYQPHQGELGGQMHLMRLSAVR
jgi:hypothetical protein